ncbi:hypothetical protein V6N13_088128 [Hibiscus sabdariffa]|uniref:C2 domain-containing protein n=1 Tax=Hibiscus sabdariffa TaxID=183260 RepID=A0ABR2FYE3_9ROSI
MELTPLELYLHCAKDLKNVNLFTKMTVYAVVSVSGDRHTAQKSPVDKQCGACPNWNYAMMMAIDEAIARRDHHNLVIRLKSDRMFGDKEIGTVQVPIRDLLDHNEGNGKVEYQNVSYSVRLPNGKTKGVLNFSYKFGDTFTIPTVSPPPPISGHPPPPSQGMAEYAYPPPGGYPPYGYQQGPAANNGYGYPPVQKWKKGMGTGIVGGLLGGMLIGDMVDGAYKAGVEDGLDYAF